MFLVDAELDAAVDAVAARAAFLGVHSAFSATGANEDTGGLYLRQAATWAGSSAGIAALSGNVDVPVNIGTWKYIGFHSAESAGTFRGMFPIGSTGFKKFYALATGDLIHSEAHGFVDDDVVVLFGAALPGGLTQATEYFVITAATDTFQVSATQGGAAVDITDEGFGVVSKLVAEVFANAGTMRVSGTTTTISGLGLRT